MEQQVDFLEGSPTAFWHAHCVVSEGTLLDEGTYGKPRCRR
jgi:hypothetical protein